MPKVFLGVGHGGKDPGAVANGLKEKDINLKVATSCADVLIRHGVEVKLSRYKDEDDPIAEVVKECNEFDADLAVDFHINSGKGDGLEIFHHSLGANSKRLAQNLEEEAKQLNNSRGLKTRLSEATGKDYYAFIRDTNPPAVIVESAFIDNAEDIKAIDEEEEQRAFGVAYAKGILKYLGIQYKAEKQIEEANKPSDWAKEAWEWGIKNKICDGTNPRGTITREQVVQMLYNFLGKGTK